MHHSIGWLAVSAAAVSIDGEDCVKKEETYSRAFFLFIYFICAFYFILNIYKNTFFYLTEYPDLNLCGKILFRVINSFVLRVVCALIK